MRRPTWHYVAFKEHRNHVIPTQAMAACLRELYDHGAVVQSPPEPRAEWTLDFGGAAFRDSSYEHVRLRGLALDVPSHHVDHAVNVLRRQRPHHVDGITFYGIPHWHWALILLPAQRHSVLAQLVAVADAARRRADDYHERLDRARADLQAKGLMAPPGVN